MNNRNNLSFYKVAVLIMVLLVAIPGYSQEVSESLENFNAIKVKHGIAVTLIPSETNKIVITGHGKEDLEYEVQNGQLELQLSLDNIWSETNTEIEVYFNNLEQIDANQGAIVHVNGTLMAKNIVLRVQEGARISAFISGEKLEAKAVTGGGIFVEGKVKQQEIEVNTAGEFHGEDLKTQKTIVSATTAGKADIWANEYCKATAKFGGTLNIYGNPQQLDTKTSFGGKIL